MTFAVATAMAVTATTADAPGATPTRSEVSEATRPSQAHAQDVPFSRPARAKDSTNRNAQDG